MKAFSPARARQSSDSMPLPTLSPDVKAHLCSILEYVLRRYKNNQFHTNTKPSIQSEHKLSAAEANAPPRGKPALAVIMGPNQSLGHQMPNLLL